MCCLLPMFIFFFFNDTATTEIYTLSLHDALPILRLMLKITPLSSRTTICLAAASMALTSPITPVTAEVAGDEQPQRDRKSTRLNSSHDQISYAVFCLKKKTPARRTSACDKASSAS